MRRLPITTKPRPPPTVITADLGEAAGLGRVTVPRIEAIDGELGGRSKTREKIRHALESAGVEFIDPNDGGPGVRLKKSRSKRAKS
jgi:hypothetical protein